MPPFRTRLPLLFLTGFLAFPVCAEKVKKEPEVPQEFQFVRSIDIDTAVGRVNRNGLGVQSIRIRSRYLDPDVNAFAGLLVGVHHFNQDLRLGDPDAPDTAGVMANWGGDFGIVRGKHLWELDLMGSSLSQRLGYALGIVGEHRITPAFFLYHRLEFNGYTGDAILDANFGLCWMVRPSVGVSAGYRWFTSQHMDRSGVQVGLRFYFESPKIPFIFPSLG